MFVSAVFVIVVFSKLLGFLAAVGARISALKSYCMLCMTLGYM